MAHMDCTTVKHSVPTLSVKRSLVCSYLSYWKDFLSTCSDPFVSGGQIITFLHERDLVQSKLYHIATFKSHSIEDYWLLHIKFCYSVRKSLLILRFPYTDFYDRLGSFLVLWTFLFGNMCFKHVSYMSKYHRWRFQIYRFLLFLCFF